MVLFPAASFFRSDLNREGTTAPRVSGRGLGPLPNRGASIFREPRVNWGVFLRSPKS